MTTNYSNLIANIFTAVNVLPQCNRPGTEDVEFWAQMTALSLNPNGCAPVDVFIAIAETLGYDWDFDSIELAMNKADAWGGTGDDFGRLEVFTIDRPNGIFGLHGKVYVEIYYDDPECDMPERYADEVDDWAEFVHEAYLQDEQAAREAEAQAPASELEAEGFTIEDVVDTYYFMYDDAYGCEHTFSFKASYGPAMQLAEELDGDGDHDCLTVYDSDLNPIYPLPF